MPKNMANWDRIGRIAIALLVAVLYFTGQISGLAATILGILAIIFVATGFMGFCPLYAPFHFSTKKGA